MTRFRDIAINLDSDTVEIGVGLTWTEVYAYLVPMGITLLEAACMTLALREFCLEEVCTLSPLSHMNGLRTIIVKALLEDEPVWLAVDNVVAYELVLPNGRVTEVAEEDEDAWFVLEVRLK